MREIKIILQTKVNIESDHVKRTQMDPNLIKKKLRERQIQEEGLRRKDRNRRRIVTTSIGRN